MEAKEEGFGWGDANKSKANFYLQEQSFKAVELGELDVGNLSRQLPLKHRYDAAAGGNRKKYFDCTQQWNLV